MKIDFVCVNKRLMSVEMIHPALRKQNLDMEASGSLLPWCLLPGRRSTQVTASLTRLNYPSRQLVLFCQVGVINIFDGGLPCAHQGMKTTSAP